MNKPAIVRVYQAFAFTTGVLIIVVFAGIPIQVWGHNKSFEEVVGTAHGFLYLGYVAVALALSLQARFNPIKTVLIAAAGIVPFCTFIAERRATRDATASINARRARSVPSQSESIDA